MLGKEIKERKRPCYLPAIGVVVPVALSTCYRQNNTHKRKTYKTNHCMHSHFNTLIISHCFTCAYPHAASLLSHAALLLLGLGALGHLADVADDGGAGGLHSLAEGADLEVEAPELEDRGRRSGLEAQERGDELRGEREGRGV